MEITTERLRHHIEDHLLGNGEHPGLMNNVPKDQMAKCLSGACSDLESIGQNKGRGR